jgi:hypothetical protein
VPEPEEKVRPAQARRIAHLRRELGERVGALDDGAYINHDSARLIEALADRVALGGGLQIADYALMPDQARLWLEELRHAQRIAPDENAAFFAQLVKQRARAVRAFGVLGHHCPEPSFATLPTGRINARLLHLGGWTEPLIAVESALPDYLQAVGRLFALGLPPGQLPGSTEQILFAVPKPDATRRHLVAARPTVLPFLRLTHRMFTTGAVAYDEIPSHAPTANLGAAAMSSGLLFLIAHEIAHVIFARDDDAPGAEPGAARFVEPSAEREEACDELALRVCAACWGDDGDWWAFVGLDFFLGCFWAFRAARLMLCDDLSCEGAIARITDHDATGDAEAAGAEAGPFLRQRRVRQLLDSLAMAGEIDAFIGAAIVHCDVVDEILLRTVADSAGSWYSIAPQPAHPRFAAF